MTGLLSPPRPYPVAGEAADRFTVATDVLGGGDGRSISEVTPRGAVDLATQAELRAGLTNPPDGHVIANLGATTFMDSSGVACLLGACEVINDRGDRLVVACPDGPVRRLLEMTGVLEILAVVGDGHAAQRALGG